MGCTTSAVVFDGLRTVLERNCSGYICKEAAEPAGPSDAERALSRRESRIIPTPRILKQVHESRSGRLEPPDCLTFLKKVCRVEGVFLQQESELIHFGIIFLGCY
ncbi:hypothetical protein CHARACLAT_027144 [Characodon lateralis]|uniref:Uncharacterized protein n=1 Tax=Characodon lateralis TaxID=208331 RepID=A0ABU7DUK5_9TELE|nr:hypothetical protein [Characodon lateralis]